MLTVYIVEDEPFARDELKYLLNRTGQVELIGEAGHVEQALQEINLLRPDIVFLDLQLGQESGFPSPRSWPGRITPRPSCLLPQTTSLRCRLLN